jgi:serine/threonine protein kinase/Flp pilus assembly protein TadD
MLIPGARLGPYEIVQHVGSGGMGEVYRARDTRLNRTVAIKVLRMDATNLPEMGPRLMHEARVIANLNHPHVAMLFGVGSREGLDYLIMEYVEGQTLATVLKQGALPPSLVVQYGTQIADALSAAHDAGLLHRDLKPANVMVTPAGRVKVLDFGVAKRIFHAGTDETDTTGLTGTGMIVGTLSYMAPEVLQGRPADKRSDIWSLGTILHELATGAPPYSGRTALEVISAILHGNLVPLPAAIPRGLRLAIGGCLEKNPSNRFQSAAELRTAVARAMPTKAPGSDTSPQRGMQDLRQGRTEDRIPHVSTGAPASEIEEANEYFEKGILFIWARPDLPRAREMLEKALALDAGFAEARAACLLYEAEDQLYRALRANENSALGHCALAATYLCQGRKELVPADVDKALKARPSRPTAVHWLAHYHRLNGNYEAAAELWCQLMKRDPLFWPARMNYGDVLLQLGDAIAAVREQEKFLEQAPQNIFAIRSLSRAYVSLGELGEARRVLDQADGKDSANYHIRISRALLTALQSAHEPASTAIDEELLCFTAANALRMFDAVELFSIVGQTAKALEWLDRTVRSGDERVKWFQRDPLLSNIHEDPRFKQIVESVAQRRTVSTPSRK